MTLDYVQLDKLRSSSNNARTTEIKDEAWDYFKESIKANGIIQPLLVKGPDAEGFYDVLAGNRRLLAMQELYSNSSGKVKAGTPDVPCDVRTVTEASDELMLSSTENLHRLNLTPQEWAEVVAKFKKMGFDQTAIAKALHRSKGWVTMVKSGKSWSEHKSKSTSRQIPQVREFEEMDCPACGNALKPRLAEGKIELEVVGREKSKEGKRKR
jgi:ParB/RepB/Spo0J family partition protein